MVIHLVAILVPALLVLTVLAPRAFANRHASKICQAVPGAIVAQLLVAIACFAWLPFQQLNQTPVSTVPIQQTFSESLVHYDGISGLMFLLVSFVGVVVSRFSIRYLDGDVNQGSYFVWFGFTFGAVSLLVLAGNLVLFFAAWFMTSFGLHHLLLHYSERPWARRAAWTKFAISRVGDLFILGALVLAYREFGTCHLAEILSRASEVVQPSLQLSLCGWLLVFGAATKSAQFPVHFWLPETMEAPTPVSALMHAGIVNAGGYLLVRWSPVVVHSPAAMATLAGIGGITAVFGSLVMMTQPAVKRALGYSTVAQMGFMMLQCGLGAFTAAMLHIIAHSLYKAHAFLRSGDAWRIEAIPAADDAESKKQLTIGKSIAGRQIVLGSGALVVASGIVLVSQLAGFHLTEKAGSVTLISVICLAIGCWLAQAAKRSWRTIAQVSLAGTLLLGAYFTSYSMIDYVTHESVPSLSSSMLLSWVGFAMVIAFTGLALLQTALSISPNNRWMQILYVHVSNGFYVDTIVRKRLGLPLTRCPSAS